MLRDCSHVQRCPRIQCVTHSTLVEPDGQISTDYPLSADQTIIKIFYSPSSINIQNYQGYEQ